MTRFSALVRKGLRFRRRFEAAKLAVVSRDFEWYPYDSFSGLFCLQRLLTAAGLSLDSVIESDPVLDLGAGDGALSFFVESLGYSVHAYDNSGTNINGMKAVRSLAEVLSSHVRITDRDLDKDATFEESYGLAMFLGTLYHLRNPYGVLEALSRRARFCFLSTRVARLSSDHTVRLDAIPIAWLLDAGECNSDVTNYWIFSYPGLVRLVNRTGWTICSALTTGARASDPTSVDGDERAFLFLRSRNF